MGGVLGVPKKIHVKNWSSQISKWLIIVNKTSKFFSASIPPVNHALNWHMPWISNFDNLGSFWKLFTRIRPTICWIFLMCHSSLMIDERDRKLLKVFGCFVDYYIFSGISKLSNWSLDFPSFKGKYSIQWSVFSWFCLWQADFGLQNRLVGAMHNTYVEWHCG